MKLIKCDIRLEGFSVYILEQDKILLNLEEIKEFIKLLRFNNCQWNWIEHSNKRYISLLNLNFNSPKVLLPEFVVISNELFNSSEIDLFGMIEYLKRKVPTGLICSTKIKQVRTFDIDELFINYERLGILRGYLIKKLFSSLPISNNIFQSLNIDEVLESKDISRKHKILFSKARGLKTRNIRTNNNVKMYINHHYFYNLTNSYVNIHSIRKCDDGNYVICGYLTTIFDISDIKVKVSLFKGDSYRDVDFLNKENKDYVSYFNSFEISVNKFECMRFKLLHIDTRVEVNIGINFGKYSGLCKNIKSSYFSIGNNIIHHGDRCIYNSDKSFISMVKREIKLLISLRRKRNVIAYRMVYWLSKWFFNNKNVSLFIDRISNAGDNAEALFKYAQNYDFSKDCYFVISKNSDDYKRLSSQGNVIEYGSIKHKLYFLHAKNVISSHASDWAKNPFMNAEQYYRDLRTFDFVFLQHGITYNDVSKSINKYNVGVNKFICSSEYELDSLKNEKYAYNDSELKLTGLPRFDLLNNSDVKKVILLAPTWRRGLTDNIDVRTGKKSYSTSFKHTEFFRRYNDLMNDPRLINVLAQTGYKILFIPHNEIKGQVGDFDSNPYVVIADVNQKYSDAFNISSLLITDYSSIFFDFSYLKKPVIFYQFDKEDFYRGHYKQGYFNLNKFSFGKVISDHDLLIDSICSLIENGDFEKDEGIIDSNDFYKFNDNLNSERVINLIFKNKLS